MTTIDGKAGVDIMTGGAGKDVFKAVIGGTTAVTAVTDKITDFEVGVDTLARPGCNNCSG